MAPPLQRRSDTASRLVVMVALVWLIMAAPWSSAAPVVLADDQQYLSLAGHLAWYRDSSGRKTIEEIVDIDRQGLFTEAAGQPSFGYTDDSIWLRFSLNYQQPGQGPWLLGAAPAFLDHVSLFSVHNNRIEDLGTQGDREAWHQRAIHWRHAVYPLPPPKDGPTTFYIKLETTSSIAANLALWRPDAFASHVGESMLFYGFLLSFGAMVCALSLLFLIFLKQSLYLYFFLYSLSYTFLVAQVEGVIHFILQPEAPLQLEWLQVIFQAAGLISITMLFSKIVDLEIYHPRANRILIRSISVVSILGIIPMLFSRYDISIPYYWIILAAIAIGIPIFSILLHRKIGLIAYMYASAFGVIAIGLLVRLAWVFGLSGPNMLSENNFMIIILIHIGIMFITLAMRYVQLEKNMRNARESALASVRQSEKKLENLVAQRTFELDQANQSLEKQLKISQQNSIDLEKTHSRLNLALDAEKKSALEQRQFLRMVAHEFRTPLSVIQMGTDLIASDPRTPDVHATTNCERIQQASERMAAIINQALREDKLDSAEWRKNASFIHIGELLHNSVSYGEMISAGKRQFHVECDDETYLQGDYDLLLTMLNNIIDNSVKYSAENSSITIKATRHQDHSVRIEITDQGFGMNKDELRHVLDKYFRADKATNIPGMGLGLYIVDRIVRMHNASLSINSTPGVGTTFDLLFPIPKNKTEMH